jgi:hypothetical protein
LDFFIDCHMARGFFSNGVCGLDIFCIMAQWVLSWTMWLVHIFKVLRGWYKDTLYHQLCLTWLQNVLPKWS